jgi:hypothetical protein
MILFEIFSVVAVIAIMFGMVPGLQAWLKSPPPSYPSRLMARLIEPDPFPGIVSAAVPVKVLVITVGDGKFAPEIGASVSFALARGNAAVNGSKSITAVTDRSGTAIVQLTALRTGADKLSVSVVTRGSTMPVAAPIHFETLA